MSADPIMFVGGVLFLLLTYLSFFDRDRLWRIYNLERGWRKQNPERTQAWDERTKRTGYVFAVIGIASIILSIVLVPGT